MKLIDKNISNIELKKMALSMHGDLVKAVVDVEKRIMVVDAELHADEEAMLLGLGSEQKNLWGINIYPENFEQDDWIEFDSMINIRPMQGNRSRGVDNKVIQEKIISIIKKLVIS